MNIKLDRSWTLFLGRDGVINSCPSDHTVKSWEEFKFKDGLLDAIPVINKVFDLTIVVTNQEGIELNLMSEKELRGIHVKMLEEITENGGYIDEIYYCPHTVTEQSEYRKPAIGMALQAMSDFKNIDLKKSIMIGQSLDDMRFGKNAGMKTILISESKELSPEFVSFTDYWMADLSTFAEILIKTQKLKF